MKFVEGSEKCPDKTAKLDAPEDNRDTEGSSMIRALFCYFQKRIRGQWIIVLWPGDVYIPVQVSAQLNLCVCSSQLLELPLPVGFAAEPLCLGFLNII